MSCAVFPAFALIATLLFTTCPPSPLVFLSLSFSPHFGASGYAMFHLVVTRLTPLKNKRKLSYLNKLFIVSQIRFFLYVKVKIVLDKDEIGL